MYKGVGFSLRIFFIFLKYSMKLEKLVSLRPNYVFSIGYSKAGRGGGVQADPRTQSGSATKHFTTCGTDIVHTLAYNRALL